MDRLNVAITLIPSEQVPEEVRRSIETAPDSVCRHDGNLYFSLEGEVLRCEDRPEGYELLSAIREKVRGSHAGNGYAKNICLPSCIKPLAEPRMPITCSVMYYA